MALSESSDRASGSLPEQEENQMDLKFPAIDMVKTGQRIMQLRKDAGLTVKDLQTIFGFATPQAIYKWQKGAAMPTLDNLVILSVVFGVAIDDMIVLENADIAIKIA